MDTLNPSWPSQAWPSASSGVEVASTTTLRTACAASQGTDENAALAGLIGAIAAGDRQALEDLYARTVTRVYPLALRITGNRETAEEVVEDVYVQVWQTAPRFDPARGGPWAWLLVICRSRSLDARRRVDPAVPMADPCELLDAASADPEGVQGLVEGAQERSALDRALRQLSASQRQLVGLAFLRGLSHSEIAQQLKLPLGTVKSQMRQALGELRRTLGDG